MRLSIFCVLSIVLSTQLPSEAYRILAIFPFNGLSHFLMFSRLMKELARRGHQVDVVSHHPLKKPIPNYNDVINLAGGTRILKDNMTYEFATSVLGEWSLPIALATEFGGELCDFMNLPRFRELIKNPPKDPPYDLLIAEVFGSTCYLALGQNFNVPVVAVVTSPAWPWVNDMVANPENPSYIPHVFSGLYGQMSFWQRIKNAFTLWKAKWQFNHHSAYQDDKIKKYIGPHAPSLKDSERNVSLILVNSHFSLHGVRPFTTGVVEVGGLHIEENESALPNDLQNWLDESRNGFVLVSFGSMLKLETFPKETISSIYSSLGKLAPTRALIKVVNKTALPPGLPNNVLTLPWIPQGAILQHKNIRAFVTHGGLMGTEEAIYHGVPMIGIPIFSDQFLNIELCVRKKIAVALDHGGLTEKNLDAAFDAVLNDPSYMKSAKKLSLEFRDRPMTALDTAIFWIEYVVRHGGRNIRSPAMDLAWWQIALLDIYGIVILTAALAIYLLKAVISKMNSVVFGSDAKRLSRTLKNE